MSKGNSIERVKMIEAFGGKVELVDKVSDNEGVSSSDMKAVEKRFKELKEKLNAFAVDQFNNEDNAWAHYYTTAEEIISDLKTVDIFVDYVGTGGSFVGVAKRFKEVCDCKCYKVVPSDDEHIIQGGGYFKEIPFECKGLCDGEISITDAEALEGMDELAKLEGLYAGISSGANLQAVIKALKSQVNKKAVILLNDVGLKYISNSK